MLSWQAKKEMDKWLLLEARWFKPWKKLKSGFKSTGMPNWGLYTTKWKMTKRYKNVVYRFYNHKQNHMVLENPRIFFFGFKNFVTGIFTRLLLYTPHYGAKCNKNRVHKNVHLWHNFYFTLEDFSLQVYYSTQCVI